MTEASAEMDTQPVENAGEVPFYGIALPLDRPTGDGRQLSSGGASVRNLPLPFNYMPGSFHGGDPGASYTVGRIDTVTFDVEAGLVRYTGVFLPSLDDSRTEKHTAAAIEMVKTGAMRGVSVDLDDISVDYQHEMELEEAIDEAGTGMEFMQALDEHVTIFAKWRVMGITQVAHPAFQEAVHALGTPDADVTPEPTAEGLALAASAAVVPSVVIASAAEPEPYPLEWFQDPQLSGPTPFTVMDDGRVFGHVATWGTCHIGYQGECIDPPHSATGYAYHRVGAVKTTGGDVAVGKITMGTGHADLRKGAAAAMAHYDNTGTIAAYIATGEDSHGIWVAGAVRRALTTDQREQLKASPLSGDWRPIRGNLELIAALAVNTPGFPIPRTPQYGLVAGAQQSLVAAGMVISPLIADGAGERIEGTPEGAPDAAGEADAAGTQDDGTAAPDTSPERIAKDLRAIDAAVDSAVAFLNGIGDETLGPDGQQARDLAVAADDVVDQLMRDLGIPDPEDEAGPPGEPLQPGLAAAGLTTEQLRAELARRDRISSVRAGIRRVRIAEARKAVAR